MKRILMSVFAAALLSCAGCNSESSTKVSASQPTQVAAPNGKVYKGTQNQITSNMGMDYGQGLRNMAAQRAAGH